MHSIIESNIRKALAITMLDYEDKNLLHGDNKTLCEEKMRLLTEALREITTSAGIDPAPIEQAVPGKLLSAIRSHQNAGSMRAFLVLALAQADGSTEHVKVYTDAQTVAFYRAGEVAGVRKAQQEVIDLQHEIASWHDSYRRCQQERWCLDEKTQAMTLSATKLQRENDALQQCVPAWYTHGPSVPEQAGFYWTRAGGQPPTIRYFDDSDRSWHVPTAEGFVLNHAFDEWLFIPGASFTQAVTANWQDDDLVMPAALVPPAPASPDVDTPPVAAVTPNPTCPHTRQVHFYPGQIPWFRDGETMGLHTGVVLHGCLDCHLTTLEDYKA